MNFFTETMGLPGFIAAIGLAVVMSGALFKVYLANGFFLGEAADGIEYVLVLLAVTIYFHDESIFAHFTHVANLAE